MITVAIANAAGSAGKSTTVVSLAGLLGQAGHKVLVVDGDAQATASEWLGATTSAWHLGDVLHRRVGAAQVIQPSNTTGVDLLPAARALDADVAALASAPAREQRLRLVLETAADYDVVLIDCPGIISLMTISALVAAESAITVTQPTMKEIPGIRQLEPVIQEVAEGYNPRLALRAIVPCIVPPANAGRLYTDAMALLQETWPTLTTPPIRRTTRIPEAHAARMPLPLYAPSDGATADYVEVYRWLVDHKVLP